MKKNLLIAIALLNALSIETSTQKNQPKKVDPTKILKVKNRPPKAKVVITTINNAKDIIDTVIINIGKKFSINALLNGQTVGYGKLSEGENSCTLYQGKPTKKANIEKNKTAPGTKKTTTDVQKIEIGKIEFSKKLIADELKKMTDPKNVTITATFTPTNQTQTSTSTDLTSTTTPIKTAHVLQKSNPHLKKHSRHRTMNA